MGPVEIGFCPLYYGWSDRFGLFEYGFFSEGIGALNVVEVWNSSMTFLSCTFVLIMARWLWDFHACSKLIRLLNVLVGNETDRKLVPIVRKNDVERLRGKYSDLDVYPYLFSGFPFKCLGMLGCYYSDRDSIPRIIFSEPEVPNLKSNFIYSIPIRVSYRTWMLLLGPSTSPRIFSFGVNILWDITRIEDAYY